MYIQRDSEHPVIGCFLEAFLCCSPPINFDPFVLGYLILKNNNRRNFYSFSYLGSTYNCWHLVLKRLEEHVRGIEISGDSALLSLNMDHQVEEKLVCQINFSRILFVIPRNYLIHYR